MTAAEAEALYGPKARLSASARVEVVRLGELVARVPVAVGVRRALVLDRLAGGAGETVSLRGPNGAIGPCAAEEVPSRLMLPDGLRRAWGVGERAVVDLGGVAVSVPVERGTETVVEIERALWLGAGQPETARWLGSVDLAPPSPADPDAGPLTLDRRVVTETDVRQARLNRRRIALRPGQIVTPSARSLGREWGVFDEA